MSNASKTNLPTQFPPQHQSKQPGIESEMRPRPLFEAVGARSSDKLKSKTAIVTGGDSGIGRAVSVAFAREGANVVIAYLSEHTDAEETQSVIEQLGQTCLLVPGDLGEESHCRTVVKTAIDRFGRIDVLVNNVAEQHPQQSISDITSDQLQKTFRTNLFSFFYMTKAVLPHLTQGSCVINTASITAYKGSPELLDYAATKGAIVAFTRSLSQSLVTKGIRVNGVAPGPIWTPLIPATLKDEQVAKFGSNTPMKRAGQPYEVASSYVFLASDDASYMTGQILHPNGGDIING